MSIKQKLLFASTLLFICSLLFPQFQVFNIAALAFLLITALIYNSLKEKLQLLKTRPYLWWMFAFFVCIVISAFLSDNSKTAFRYVDPRLPLVFFPLTIGLVKLDKTFRDNILMGIGVVITITSIICLVYGIYRSMHFNDTAYLYNDALTKITRQQSIYISLLVNCTIYIFSYFIFYKPGFKYKGWLVVAILFLFFFSFMLASRNLMLVLYASTIGFGFYYVFKKKKYLEGATMILGLVIGIFLVFKFFPKTINRFRELTFTQFNYQQDGPESHYNMDVATGQWNGVNTRIAIWQCGWDLFKQNPLFGVHIGDKKVKLLEEYRQKNFEFGIRTQKNLHNNYLDILVSMGIIGLMLFLISWIFLPLLATWRAKDGLALLIMLTFALAMVTEIYFDRSLGGMLFGFFIPFLLSSTPGKKETITGYPPGTY